MNYTIDSERGILFQIEDMEADEIALLDPVAPEPPPIPLAEAVKVCQRESDKMNRALEAIG